jgi:hypothetical protein
MEQPVKAILLPNCEKPITRGQNSRIKEPLLRPFLLSYGRPSACQTDFSRKSCHRNAFLNLEAKKIPGFPPLQRIKTKDI